jgi:hypothetical protein
MQYSEPYYTTSPFGKKQMWLPAGVLSQSQRNDIKKLIEQDASLRPAWFFTGTYWEKYGARQRLSVARAAWDNAMVSLSQKTSQHLIAIAAWGATSTGDYHMHGVVSGERGKIKRLTQAKLRKAWRGGISDMRRYDPSKGAVPYTLAHEHIAYQTKVYCPHGGCDRCEKFQRDYVDDVLRASATSTSDEASSYGVADPSQAAFKDMEELRKVARRNDFREHQLLRKLGHSTKECVEIMKQQRAELLERTKPK